MEKIEIIKFSDYWGEYDCSSNRNIPKYFSWETQNTNYENNICVYVDDYIVSQGFNNSKKDKIGWLLESPQINQNTINYLLNNIEKTKENFKWIFTCLDSLLEVGLPFTYNISNASPWIWEKNRMIHPKTKLVSMISSDKGWLRGHQERLLWVEKLKNKVDLFGRGRDHQLKDKEDGIRDYMFSVSIENDTSDCYFTEKLTDNFVMGTIPIYHGSRKVIEKYFDVRGVIFLEDDPNLETISENKYYDMMPYVEKNFEIAMNLPLAEDYMWENYLKKLF